MEHCETFFRRSKNNLGFHEKNIVFRFFLDMIRTWKTGILPKQNLTLEIIMSTKKMSFENVLSVENAMTQIDVQEIEKTIAICATEQKRKDNAIEFLNVRKSIDGEIHTKKTKNAILFKNINDLQIALKDAKKDNFVICAQSVRLSDGIYQIDAINARILKEKKRPSNPSYIPETGIETIGRKDAKGRKMELFLTFERNTQGILIKIS